MKAKDKEVPDLLGDLPPKKKRGRPRKKPSLTAAQIAESMEKEGRFWLEQAKILRRRSK